MRGSDVTSTPGSRAHFDGDVCSSDWDRIENMTQHYQLLIVVQWGFNGQIQARSHNLCLDKSPDSVIMGH